MNRTTSRNKGLFPVVEFLAVGSISVVDNSRVNTWVCEKEQSVTLSYIFFIFNIPPTHPLQVYVT